VIFSSEQYAIVYAKSVMDSKLSEQTALPTSSCTPAEASRDVMELVEMQLRSSADVSRESIAKRLASSTRTMQRRLAEEGTSFQQLLEDTRKRLAVELLAAPSEYAIKEVAALLGYVAVRSFERAFRRWTGESPGVWRNRSLNKDTRS